jgi:phage/plasmid-associated DNA primase
MKAIISGDIMSYREPYQYVKTIHPICKIWVEDNHVPQWIQQDMVWRNRFVPVRMHPLTHAPDEHLLEKLQEEMTEIYQWALEGRARWRATHTALSRVAQEEAYG